MVCLDHISLDILGKSKVNTPHTCRLLLGVSTRMWQGPLSSASGPGNITDCLRTLGGRKRDFKHLETPCHMSG